VTTLTRNADAQVSEAARRTTTVRLVSTRQLLPADREPRPTGVEQERTTT